MCLLGGVAGGTVISCAKPSEKKSALEGKAFLFRNPAFVKRREAQGAVVSTTGPDGKTIAYRLDEGAEFLWDCVPSPEGRTGSQHVTVDELVEKAVAEFSSRSSVDVRADARAFLEEAVLAGVLVPPKATAYVVNEVRFTK